MIRALCVFLLLLASVLLGLQLHNDPGYVLISINHWTIETTLWFALFLVLFAFIIIHISIQLLHKLGQMPRTIHQWNARRLANKAQAITRQGLIEYSEGYWQKAQTHLIQALPNTDTPLLNYLTAARAAQKMGDSQLRDHYLREAQQSMPEAKIAVELTQAQLQLANQQWEQALATLRHLHDLAPRHPYVLKLLIKLYEQVRDWQQLITLLPRLKKHNVLSPQELESLQLTVYSQAMLDLEKQSQPEALIKLFNNLPKNISSNPDLLSAYVGFLLRIENYQLAEDVLKRHLRKEFQPKLVELYSLLPCNESQLTFIESLLKKNPHSDALYRCLGRQAIAQHLWGKAKQYLEQALELNPTPSTYNELGKLYEHLNDSALACDFYKKGLALATN
ncbi:heme biosynthesis HemY N-terminal domain-containing protein [Legionella sp. km772]|uniref:heme biosynthesis HemY N-terminal domain-containing protein n=1 Tax=Legionella sp. km772 TaxID=2498111 RepID=UPI000F8F52DA|nr:heme biosynthesis HemY N-terminal domain-containing protein [Legionella sp. km772]RUR12024.1 protoporphyrinogen oxidase [Legionella sp. km772]